MTIMHYKRSTTILHDATGCNKVVARLLQPSKNMVTAYKVIALCMVVAFISNNALMHIIVLVLFYMYVVAVHGLCQIEF